MRRYLGTLPLLAMLVAISTAVFSENAAPSTKSDSEALYTVQNGKIVREEFMYGVGGQG